MVRPEVDAAVQYIALDALRTARGVHVRVWQDVYNMRASGILAPSFDARTLARLADVDEAAYVIAFARVCVQLGACLQQLSARTADRAAVSPAAAAA